MRAYFCLECYLLVNIMVAQEIIYVNFCSFFIVCWYNTSCTCQTQIASTIPVEEILSSYKILTKISFLNIWWYFPAYFSTFLTLTEFYFSFCREIVLIKNEKIIWETFISILWRCQDKWNKIFILDQQKHFSRFLCCYIFVLNLRGTRILFEINVSCLMRIILPW